MRIKNRSRKEIIHDLNMLLERPLSLVIILLALFCYFAYGNYHFQKDNKLLLERTKSSADNTAIIVDQLKKVLCEKVPAKDCNLSKAVAELKADNERQTRFIGCLLAIHGEGALVSEEVRNQCAKMADNIALTDVTKSKSGSTPATKTPASSQGGGSGGGSNSGGTGKSQPSFARDFVDFVHNVTDPIPLVNKVL